MNYIAYFNGIKLELRDIKIPQNKQINTIGRLDTRQTNFTQKFTIDPTPNNLQAFDLLGVVGNTSRKPYEQNEFDLIDANSGLHLIYKGFAKITQVTAKGIELNVEDGIVDFYRRIENKTLSDLDLSELSHIKNVPNVINSFTGTLPYKYIFADYNGKLITQNGNINADYLIPSVLISYLWNKIHEFTEYTFSGAIFDSVKFTNLWMTYPKPVPTTSPVVTFVQQQQAQFTPLSSAFDANGNLNGNIPYYGYYLFPTLFSNTQVQNIGENRLKVLVPGTYRLTCIGNLLPQNYYVTDLNGIVLNSGQIITNDVGFVNIISCPVPSIITFGSYNFYTLFQRNYTCNTTLELIDGYTVNFLEALIDFKISDFYNQILHHFALTPFKDNYSNVFEYKQLPEILNTTTAIDWSSKFDNQLAERFIYDNYAKQNNFKYRYDKDDQRHNDGFFTINNFHLKPETTVIASRFYSPEPGFENTPLQPVKRYKFWDKEVKEVANSTATTIEYKEIKNRFYLHRFTNTTISGIIESELLSQSQPFTFIHITNFDRLNMQEVIFDNYSQIGSIVNNAKIMDLQFYLTPNDYINFDFKKLIFVKQLQKYFLVNKISNFTKGLKTKVECIALATTDIVAQPPIYIAYSLFITSYTQNLCNVTLNVVTNLPDGTSVRVLPWALTGSVLGYLQYSQLPMQPIIATITSGSVTFATNTIQPAPLQKFAFTIAYGNDVIYNTYQSNIIEDIIIPETCYIP